VTRFTKPAQEKVNHSNPSFGQLPNPYGEDTMDLSSQVIKVYRGDHTSRFFVLTKVCFVYTPQSVFPSGRNRPKRQSVGAYFWQYDCIMSAELTKTPSFRLFFVDFSHWARRSVFEQGINSLIKAL